MEKIPILIFKFSNCNAKLEKKSKLERNAYNFDLNYIMMNKKQNYIVQKERENEMEIFSLIYFSKKKLTTNR